MQSQTEIRQLLESEGLAPHRRFGQNFLIDQNLMNKVLEIAAPQAGRTILEVGPGTGSLTEELLARGVRVVACEIDHGLCRLLTARLGSRPDFTLIAADALKGKHAIEPAVLAALGPAADLVANLPYNIATPLVAVCLLDSWAALRGQGGKTLFSSLTFTVQLEVGDRLVARPQTADYGPVSVIVSLLGKAQLGPTLPAAAFWPRPAIVSRVVRIDFDPAAAARLADASTLRAALALVFGQRRKQVKSVTHRKHAAFAPETFAAALATAGIDPGARADDITPEQFLNLANALAATPTPESVGDPLESWD